MQQLAGPLGLLNPLFLQQVAAYGNYTQVCSLFADVKQHVTFNSDIM
jgi:hypothetical protein